MKAVSAILLILSTGLWAVAQETATSTNTNGKPETIREMVNPAVSGSGKTNYVPLWLNPTTLGNSRIFQVGGKVGIDTTAPQFLLDVNGSINAKVSYLVGGTTFAFGSLYYYSAFLGFSGNNTTTGYGNTANGYNALHSNTTGSSNTASGYATLSNNSTGGGNTADGVGALVSNTTGWSNSASGGNAVWQNTTGSYNTSSGFDTLYSNTTGTGNTAGGYKALYSNTTGYYNTALGYEADVGSGNVGNATAIGANAYVTQSNTLVLGCVAGVNGCSGPVSVGIGTTAPDNMLTVNGSADKPGGGSWGTYSDRRLKNLNGSYSSGLSQVLRINPIRYRYKADNAMGIHDTDEHIGVVAQDVQKVIPEAVTENSKGYLLVNNDPIIWSMLNAIKEQQREIRDLKSELRATRQSLQKVKAQGSGSRLTVVAAK